MSIYNVTGNAIYSADSVTGTPISKAYNVNGVEVFSAKAYPITNNYTMSVILDIGAIMSGTQGLAANSLTNELAQLYTGRIIMIDADTGEYRQVASALNMLHGGAGQFKPTKEDSGDEYPLLYVSGGQSIADGDIRYSPLLEIKIENDTSATQRVFVADEGNAIGGGGHFAIDFDNLVAYHVYSTSYYAPDDPSNSHTYISAWDMTQYEQITAPTTNPAPKNGWFKFTSLLDSFEILYVAENQSVSFIDGTIVLISDVGNNSVVCVDAEEKRVYLTLSDDMPPNEIEGVAFLPNPITGKQDMILNARNNSSSDPHNWYYRYQFT